MKWTPRRLRALINVYPPYVGAGIRVTHIDPEWRELRVTMRLRWFNKNIVGVHFGGSLYSMVDPHLMVLMMNALGDEYIVWDKAAAIDFVRPGKGRVHATFRITDEDLDAAREATRSGRPYRPEFDVEVVDEAGEVVVRVRKTLYVRRKRPSGSARPGGA